MPPYLSLRRSGSVCILILGLQALAGPAAANTPPAFTHTAEHHTPHSTHSPHQAWNLTTEEWQRFEQLMDGPLGIYSPNIDPLTALGIEARSDEERLRYARLQVQAEAQRVEKLLAYQRAYDAAWQQQFPGLPVLLDETQASDTLSATLRGLNPAPASGTNRLLLSQAVSSARLAVFVEDNCPVCETAIQKLQAEGQAFDLYMVGSEAEDSRIRAWARQSGIQPDKVRAGHITLNHDSGRWQTLGLSGGLPAIVREVNGSWQRQ